MGKTESRIDHFRLSLVGLAVLLLCASLADAQVPTTLDNFFHPGTQPDTSNGKNFAPFVSAGNCSACHEVYNPPVEYPIYSRWAGSMMANSARDPLFQASLAVANQDVAFSGDLCIRCHSPNGWLGGRSTPTDGSALVGDDFEGVSCNFCHRMVDPVFTAGVSPPR
ncbi:MAG: multiheme c-type cytochrome, partial [Planctomycetota bacterium]